MVDLDQLAGAARSTAEWSRLRMGLRAAVVVLALAVIAIGAGGAAVPCACIGVTLATAVVALRWWSREGVDAVWLGLGMGTVPLLAAALLPACGVECAPPGKFGHAEIVCVVAGLIAGVGLACFADRGRRPWRAWMLATAIAGLTATLGCVPLGLTGLAVTLGAVIVASASVRIPLLVRAG